MSTSTSADPYLARNRRIGLLDRTAVFDEDDELHARIETIASGMSAERTPPAGPPRHELVARMHDAVARVPPVP